MAAYPTFTLADLANHSGKVPSEYTNTAYVPSAIQQAVLLFKLGTCLPDRWPDNPMMAELAKMGILAMAQAIYQVQQYQDVLANPFSSESIGSYSYSKVAGAVMGGLPTGIQWFDLAISKLSVCDISDGIPMGGGIEAFEWDLPMANGVIPGNTRLIGPADLNLHDYYMHDPSEGHRPSSAGGSMGDSGDFSGGGSSGSLDGGSFE